MTNKKVIEVLQTERECVLRNWKNENCDRDCACCDLLLNEDEIISAYDAAMKDVSARDKIKPDNFRQAHDTDLWLGNCPKCGVIVNSEMDFCYHCGHGLDWSE